MPERTKEKGNVLFLILIAVALFAALSYVVTQSSRTSSTSIRKEKTDLIASELLNASAAIRNGVTRLTTLGCTETTINFYSPTPYYYMDNPLSPPDKHCNLHDGKGAGLSFTPHMQEGQTNRYSTSYSSLNHFENLGSDCASAPLDACNDLALFIIDVPLEVCKRINQKLGIEQPGFDTPEVPDVLFGTGFVGSYAGNSKIGDSGNSTALKGKPIGCVKETSVQSYSADVSSTQTPYIYYHVLIER